jgi:cyclin C
MAADFWLSSHGFALSSLHCLLIWSSRNHWLFDRQRIAQARAQDLQYATPQEVGWIGIWSANGPSPSLRSSAEPMDAVLHRLSRKLNLKQQVTATAIVFFRRFYLTNSYAGGCCHAAAVLCESFSTETEPCLVAAACLYVAAKAEELPVHIKSIVAEARSVFQGACEDRLRSLLYASTEMGFSSFPTDNSKLAQMEFCKLGCPAGEG